MTEFRFKDIKIRICFSFLVFLSMLFLLKNGKVIFSFFTVCLLHEAGHAAALYIAGGRISALILCGMGIKMIPRTSRLLSVRSEAAVILAGPLVNLLVFILLNFFNRGNSFAVLNLCAALFNLMPYKLLDGGSLINLLSNDTPYERVVSVILSGVRISFIVASLYASVFIDEYFFSFFCASVFYFVSEFR